MNEREFCYWLQGFFELSENIGYINPTQTKVIQDHLNLVFKKVTPNAFTNTRNVTSMALTGLSPNIYGEVGYQKSPFDFEPQKYPTAHLGTPVEDRGYQKIFTGHTGITAAGLC